MNDANRDEIIVKKALRARNRFLKTKRKETMKHQISKQQYENLVRSEVRGLGKAWREATKTRKVWIKPEVPETI